MARLLYFFAEYNFPAEYKPGRLNVLADALSRRPDYAVKTADANRIGVERVSAPSSSLINDVKAAYANDADAKQLLSYASAPSCSCTSLSFARRTAAIQRSGRRCGSHRRVERL
ncbi:hypothetical protein PC129_g24664 [Phytophthora cactorum]|uniref:Uncharacterized protein n=1 Tax=Phytophthora cactorum TaxID=29920 RepID=A0A8T1J780_9STRA|nr:hypothetical protein Pcac1_g21951 [Phytophthora cactorum]KAG3181436.1 hypothetical protein PC128_g15139 [Phytophthora cactorum]KAG3196566.1 hypothetical protein PC129_g24664 [Phytophthora cactorum]KAG4219996.1 hypothetical protein PC116_g31525 [Phytophthora cactorum]